MERARKALRGDDLNEINAAQEELSKVFAEAGQSFYAQSQASSGSGGPTGGPTSGPEGGPTAGSAGAKPEDVEAFIDLLHRLGAKKTSTFVRRTIAVLRSEAPCDEEPARGRPVQ